MENNKLESYLQGVAVQQYKSDIGFRTLVESVMITCILFRNIRENIDGKRNRLLVWLSLC